MTPVKSRLLIVDTSVMRAAGMSEHPVSSACRETLQAVLDICHRVALTDTIRAEWKRHRSRFSGRWWRSMLARRKVSTLISPASITLDTSAYTPANRRVVEKDRCLIEAALAADGVLVTADDEFREALETMPKGKALSDRIRWLHPVRDGVQSLTRL